MIELFPFILITILLLIYYLNTRKKKNAAYNAAIDKEIAVKHNTLACVHVCSITRTPHHTHNRTPFNPYNRTPYSSITRSPANPHTHYIEHSFYHDPLNNYKMFH